jgi:hypothetical protein
LSHQNRGKRSIRKSKNWLRSRSRSLIALIGNYWFRQHSSPVEGRGKGMNRGGRAKEVFIDYRVNPFVFPPYARSLKVRRSTSSKSLLTVRNSRINVSADLVSLSSSLVSRLVHEDEPSRTVYAASRFFEYRPPARTMPKIRHFEYLKETFLFTRD